MILLHFRISCYSAMIAIEATTCTVWSLRCQRHRKAPGAVTCASSSTTHRRVMHPSRCYPLWVLPRNVLLSVQLKLPAFLSHFFPGYVKYFFYTPIACSFTSDRSFCYYLHQPTRPCALSPILYKLCLSLISPAKILCLYKKLIKFSNCH